MKKVPFLKEIISIVLILASFQDIHSAQEMPACTSKVVSTYSLIDIMPQLLACAQTSLYLIDIDDTLLIAHDKIMRNANLERHNLLKARLGQEPNGDLLTAEVFNRMRYQLLEPIFPSLIDELKQTSHGVFGFTARPLQPFYFNDRGEDFISRQLAKLNIHFSCNARSFHVLKHGIFFCGNNPKGDMLKDFFASLNGEIDFNNIVLIDDRLDNINHVAHAIEEWNKLYNAHLSFLGVHYKAADLFDHTINESILEKQLYLLLTHGIYYSEFEIENMINPAIFDKNL